MTAPYRILRIDLGEGRLEEEEVPSNVAEKYVGGKGLAAYYMYRELRPRIDPLSVENKIFIFTGPLSGLYPTFPRLVIASKSPLSGTFSDSNAGGSFAVELRRLGYIGLIVEGAADRLSCVVLDRERRIVNCEALRHALSSSVAEAFPEHSVMSIGPAGENMVRFANVLIDYRKNPTTRPGVAGRGGLGAVFGSKRLKAIAIKSRGNSLGKPDSSLVKEYLAIVRGEVMRSIGIGGNLPVFRMAARAKILPVKNFTSGTIDGWEELTAEGWEKNLEGRLTCPTCPVACGTKMRAGSASTPRIEYETVAMMGPNLGIVRREPLIEMNELLNELGMDSISAGAVAALVTELEELGKTELGLSWGSEEGYKKLLLDIAYRRGIGDLLAEGSARAAKALGAEGSAVHTKGLEIPAYDPRGVVGMALAYATADRGGDHLRAWTVVAELEMRHSLEELVKLTIRLQNRNAALWTLVACDNIVSNSSDPDKMVEIYIRMLSSIGVEVSYEEFYRLGERIYNVTRLYNAREGFTREHDSIPARFFEKRKDMGWRILPEDFERMLSIYYAERGWDERGVPRWEKLKELGISE